MIVTSRYTYGTHKDGRHVLSLVTNEWGRDQFPHTKYTTIRDDFVSKQAAKHAAERLNGEAKRPFSCDWTILSDGAFKSMQRYLSQFGIEVDGRPARSS